MERPGPRPPSARRLAEALEAARKPSSVAPPVQAITSVTPTSPSRPRSPRTCAALPTEEPALGVVEGRVGDLGARQVDDLEPRGVAARLARERAELDDHLTEGRERQPEGSQPSASAAARRSAGAT